MATKRYTEKQAAKFYARLNELIAWLLNYRGDVDRGALEESTHEIVCCAFDAKDIARIPDVVYDAKAVGQIDAACAIMGIPVPAEITAALAGETATAYMAFGPDGKKRRVTIPTD